MCRLLAATRGADRGPLERMRVLSRKHGDGWGAAWWSSSLQGYVRSSKAAYQTDSGFAEAEAILARPRPVTYVCHIRKRSVAPTKVSNSHPFVGDGWAFAHNGTLPWLESGDRTDSEKFFETEILPGLRAGEDPIEVIRGALEHARPTYTSLNSILTDGRRMFALEAHLTKPDYYTLRWHRDARGVCVASADVAPAEWQVLGDGNLLVIDGGVRTVRVSSASRRLSA